MGCKNIVVAGTDTDIGKTALSFLIMKELISGGKKPVYIKPFQTGCTDVHDRDSDAKFIYENLGLKQDYSKSVILCNKKPKAPFFAARDDNETIYPDKVYDKIKEMTHNYSHSVIELSGGLLVPLTENLLQVDFIKRFDCEVVLAARAGLGTINHTLMSVEILKQRGIEPYHIVFIDKDGDTEKEMIGDNIEAVTLFTGKKPGFFGKIDNFRDTDIDLNLF